MIWNDRFGVGLRPTVSREMKCRGWRPKSCCCCVDLRAGCSFLAVFEIFSSILGFCVGEEGHLFVIGRFGYMLHFIGSIFLLMSSFLQIETLVVIYLGTNIFHLIFCTAFLIDYALSCQFCLLESIPAFVTFIISIYFWLVAFAYLRRLQWENNPENDD